MKTRMETKNVLSGLTLRLRSLTAGLIPSSISQYWCGRVLLLNNFRQKRFVPAIVALAIGVATLTSFPVPASAGNIVVNPNFSPANAGAGYGAVLGWTQVPYPASLDLPYQIGSNTSVQPFWNNGTVPIGILTVGFIQVLSVNT